MKKLLLAMAMLPAIGAYAQTAPVKKVLLEDFTGINCPWCPPGTVILEDLKAAHPTTMIPVATHAPSSYEPASSTVRYAPAQTLLTGCDVAAFPSGAVDRKEYPARVDKAPNFPGIAMSRTEWGAAYNARAAMTANVSVSFTNLKQTSNDVFEGDVNFNFSSLPTANHPLVLQVFVLEDSIPAVGVIKQVNHANSPVQGGASPLQNWFHNRTLRKHLGSSIWGWTVASILPAGVTQPVVGTTYTKHFEFTKDASWVKKNLQLVAFISYNGTGADSKEVLNAEEASLGGKFVTGINEVKNVEITNVYPNPAMQNDIIRMQYNTTADAKVNMVVMNLAGQVVAHPYASADIAGTHTIQWRAADHNLAPGMYIMQISTDKGETTTQKINIR